MKKTKPSKTMNNDQVKNSYLYLCNDSERFKQIIMHPITVDEVDETNWFSCYYDKELNLFKEVKYHDEMIEQEALVQLIQILFQNLGIVPGKTLVPIKREPIPYWKYDTHTPCFRYMIGNDDVSGVSLKFADNYYDGGIISVDQGFELRVWSLSIKNITPNDLYKLVQTVIDDFEFFRSELAKALT